MATYDVDIKKLFEAGAHFGHKTSKWNPKMARFIHSKKNGVHIINLEKTVECLENSLNYISKLTSEGKQILFVGTKPQAQLLVKDFSMKLGLPYITKRWLGGTLTNWSTISSRIRKLKELEQGLSSGEISSKYSKLEIQRIQEQIKLMNENYEGIKDLKGLPGALFVIDTVNENICIKEAIKLKIPVIALVDSNSNPDLITYPIPANDDAIKTIKLILDLVEKAIENGRNKSK